jgi:hypothetical protein
MTPKVIGLILILLGVIHVVKPSIFREIMQRKIVFNSQRYTPSGFKIAIRILGGFLILIGLFLTIANFKA